LVRENTFLLYLEKIIEDEYFWTVLENKNVIIKTRMILKRSVREFSTLGLEAPMKLSSLSTRALKE
jgi:hypothetical protein